MEKFTIPRPTKDPLMNLLTESIRAKLNELVTHVMQEVAPVPHGNEGHDPAMVMADGLTKITVSASTPTSPSQGDLWVDTGGKSATIPLKMWNGSAWVDVAK